MTHAQGNRARAVGLVVAAGVLTACTSGPVPQPSPTTKTTSATEPSSSAPAATTLACGTPPEALVDRAGMSVAAHPGPITATTYVFAATTDTGDWYVLGLDRAYVHDDGTPAEGPDGDHSRSLALTNESRTTDGEVAMIPLSVAVSDRTPVRWDRVSWTGDTLAAGRRAADTAIACLESQRSG